MRDKFLSALAIVCIGLLFFGGMWAGRRSAPRCNVESVTKQYDSLTSYVANIPIPKHKDSIITKEVIVEIPAEVDTNAVVADYFKRRTFVTEYRDTNIAMTIRPVVSMNMLDSLSLEYKWLRPVSKTTVLSKPSNEFYGGVGLGIGQVSPMVLWNTKDKWVFGASYNIIDPSVNLYVAYRIF